MFFEKNLFSTAIVAVSIDWRVMNHIYPIRDNAPLCQEACRLIESEKLPVSGELASSNRQSNPEVQEKICEL